MQSPVRRPGDHTAGARGQSMVEFALAFPVVLLLIVGLLDFGRAIYVYNSVSNAARSAARVAVIDQNVALIEAVARREAVGVEPLTVERAACFTMDCMYGVTVSHAFQPATPFIGAIVGTITLDSTASMPVEREYSSP